MTTTAPEKLTGGVLIPRGGLDPNHALPQVRMLAKFLDSAFTVPGTRFRFGFDPLIDLVPVVGDAVGAAIGSYILVTGARLGLPRAVLARMLWNIGIDAVVGAVPFVGPLLDAGYRSNTKNVRLLEAALVDADRTRRTSRWAVWGLVAAVLAIVAGGVVASVALFKLIWNALP
jgi:hypothetical protein